MTEQKTGESCSERFRAALPVYVVDAEFELRDAKHNLDEALTRATRRCSHKRIVETEYVPRTFGSATPPRRMCLRCRIEEEGWGCGYNRLSGDVEAVLDRDDFYALRPPR